MAALILTTADHTPVEGASSQDLGADPCERPQPLRVPAQGPATGMETGADTAMGTGFGASA